MLQQYKFVSNNVNCTCMFENEFSKKILCIYAQSCRYTSTSSLHKGIEQIMFIERLGDISRCTLFILTVFKRRIYFITGKT